jgi:mRNA-degrading endonuclease RelE of RelBE toxin-antitoxin system
MLQIVFNEISAAEISQLNTLQQLDLLDEFKVTPADLSQIDKGTGNPQFGVLNREGAKKLYRFRAKDYRIYFTATDTEVKVLRVLNKNTFKDFLLRNNLPGTEDEALSNSKTFWKLIDEAKSARSV